MLPTLVRPPSSSGPHHAPRLVACCVMEAVGTAAPALRAFARAVAARWDLALDDYALALVVSELVGNAVRHSGSPDVRLLLSADARVLTVTVSDSGRWRPGAVGGEGLACGGRGIQLVRAHALRFSVRSTFAGTQVRADLPLLRTASDPASQPPAAGPAPLPTGPGAVALVRLPPRSTVAALP
ncbi:ATP-binding protein, partial [Kitasatospora sp. NPDC057198]|uniref:ATP-binding protein n=1 Tax=Kitasatospora sp. NPDC057198 TaxID=3346046 RepID=UPI003630E3E9